VKYGFSPFLLKEEGEAFSIAGPAAIIRRTSALWQLVHPLAPGGISICRFGGSIVGCKKSSFYNSRSRAGGLSEPSELPLHPVHWIVSFHIPSL